MSLGGSRSIVLSVRRMVVARRGSLSREKPTGCPAQTPLHAALSVDDSSGAAARLEIPRLGIHPDEINSLTWNGHSIDTVKKVEFTC